jgi:hypothetical protein
VVLPGVDSTLRYKSTGGRLELRHIPHYRVEVAAGVEYMNRAASGTIPELGTDSRNTGKLLLQTTLRIADGRYRNLIDAEFFAARESILGDFDFSGGTVALHNRFLISENRDMYLDWSIQGGSARGALPIEEYFVLGTDTQGGRQLRGHTAARDGRYGNAPMGTDFLLANLDVERRLTALPLFNTFNLPYLIVKWELFVDAAKTFDRARLFEQGKLWVDAGAGLKFETPTHAFNLVYGRSLRDGDDVFHASIEKRW